MTVDIMLEASRTLTSMSNTIQISENNDQVQVDEPELRCHWKQKPRLVWTAPFEFMLYFKNAANSPVDHGQYWFCSKPFSGGWRVVIMLRKVTIESNHKYDVVSDYPVLDPVIIIDPN